MENLLSFSLLGLSYGQAILICVVGVACLLIGFWKGRYDNDYLSQIIEQTIDDLIDEGYIKTEKKFNPATGKWDIAILKYNEDYSDEHTEEQIKD